MPAEDFALALADTIANHGDPISYEVAPSDSSQSASSSTFNALRPTRTNSGSSEEFFQASGWIVLASDVAAPKREDAITEGGITWRVKNVEPIRGVAFRLYVEHSHAR